MPRLILAALLFVTASTQASTIDFGFADLSLVFDGSTLQDSNLTGGDDVIITTVRKDGLLVPDSPLLGNALIDFFVPDLSPLTDGTPVLGTEGFLNVEAPGGETVSLSIESVQIQYTDLGGFAQFVFGGAIAEVVAPSSPEATISFASTVSEQQEESGEIVSFEAEANGQVDGAVVVPEPAAIVTVCLLAGAASAAAAIRSKLG